MIKSRPVEVKSTIKIGSFDLDLSVAKDSRPVIGILKNSSSVDSSRHSEDSVADAVTDAALDATFSQHDSDDLGS